MIYYCIQVWGDKQIRGDQVFWPVLGRFKDWMCRALDMYVDSGEPFGLEEREYANLWMGLDTRIHVFALGEKNHGRRTGGPEELPTPPPHCVPPALAPGPAPLLPPLPQRPWTQTWTL